MSERITNRLREERDQRQWSQSRIAELVGITRQSYSAIESGAAIPGTDISLRLAQAFGVGVEELFVLPTRAAETVVARWVGDVASRSTRISEGSATSPGRSSEARHTGIGQRVRLGRVGGNLFAMPAAESFRPMFVADGVVTRARNAEGNVEVSLMSERPPAPDLTVAGCDPGFSVIAEILGREQQLEIHYRQLSSRRALEALAAGECHVAGSHLKDSHREDGNARWVEAIVPFPCTRFTYAIWEQGLILAPGNPLGIRSAEDLARPDVRLLNREPGSGSRVLLDELLKDAGVESGTIKGYESAARGHVAVAEGIAAGLADVGVAIPAPARTLGLDVVPLNHERYELIVPNHFLDLPAIVATLRVLRRSAVRAQIEAMGGYDCVSMGELS